jgi:uncharacterized protein
MSTPGHVIFVPSKGPVVSVMVRIVEKPEEQARGLSGIAKLPEDEGMLFWFGVRGNHGFYMRNVQIPLDCLFLDFNRVVGILTLAPQDLTVHKVGRLSSAVLEVNGGWAERKGVLPGDRVQIALDA